MWLFRLFPELCFCLSGLLQRLSREKPEKITSLNYCTTGQEGEFVPPSGSASACLHRRLWLEHASVSRFVASSWQDADSDPTGEAAAATQQMLTYYELDLGLNHVVRKYSEPLEEHGNFLIAGQYTASHLLDPAAPYSFLLRTFPHLPKQFYTTFYLVKIGHSRPVWCNRTESFKI